MALRLPHPRRSPRAVVVHRRARGRGTWALGAIAFATGGAAVAGEVAYVWRRGTAPLPAQTDDVLGAAAEAARQAGEVAVEGYREASDRENALFNLLLAFSATFGLVRLGTHTIRARGRFGPIRNVTIGDRHIHHFVPGIMLAFVSGAASILSRDEELDKWLAGPFGVGVALTLDESALLLALSDVYWNEEGILSVQVGLGTIAGLASLTLAIRLLRRGEARVLPPVEAAVDQSTGDPATPSPRRAPAPCARRPPSR